MTAPTDPPVYNPEIPQREDFIADGQTGFLDNFTTLYDAFVKNHVALDDATNPGDHTNIQLVEQTQSPSTQSQEISIYSKKVDGQTDQLFMRYPSNGKEFQITNYQIYSIPATATQEAYFSFLPGGIIVYFGTSFCAGTTTFNININPPVKQNIMGVNLGGIGTAQVQPNVSLQTPVNGFYNNLILSSASNSTGSLPMVNQFYLIFGNI